MHNLLAPPVQLLMRAAENVNIQLPFNTLHYVMWYALCNGDM